MTGHGRTSRARYCPPWHRHLLPRGYRMLSGYGVRNSSASQGGQCEAGAGRSPYATLVHTPVPSDLGKSQRQHVNNVYSVRCTSGNSRDCITGIDRFRKTPSSHPPYTIVNHALTACNWSRFSFFTSSHTGSLWALSQKLVCKYFVSAACDTLPASRYSWMRTNNFSVGVGSPGEGERSPTGATDAAEGLGVAVSAGPAGDSGGPFFPPSSAHLQMRSYSPRFTSLKLARPNFVLTASSATL